MSYDPLKDEKTLYTIREWGEEAKAAIDEYVRDLENQSDIVRKPHTWGSWMKSFLGFMSW